MKIIRYFKSCPPSTGKTTRCYGEVAAAVRKVAMTGKPFTWRDVPLAQPHRAAILMNTLARNGELLKVRRGINGNGGKPGIFKINKKDSTYANRLHSN